MADSSVDEAAALVPEKAPAIPIKIAQVIIKAQKTLKPLVKSATNDLYGSGYVPLEDVADKAYDLLASNGIGVTQPLTTLNGELALETTLFTGSGQSFTRTAPLLLSKKDPQGVLAAITYYRRGALMTTLGLTAKGEDDDGNKASGVQVPVEEEQINEIKMLLALMRWTRDDITKAVFAIKTKDAATLAINKYRDLVSERVRDDESRENATKIEVEGVDDPVIDESTPEGTIAASLKALGLKNALMEKQFIYKVTNKTSLAKVKDPADLKELAKAIELVASGQHPLPAEYYPDKGERIVNEDVA